MWTRSGYGDWGISVAKSLYRYDKFDLVLVPTRWGACSRKFSSDEIDDPVEKKLFEKVIKQPLTRQPDLYIHCTIPNEFQPVGKYNIGMTAGIETTVARPEWVEGLNRMNMNIVTSVHSRDVFEKARYQKQINQQSPPVELKSLKPMEVLFWGADTQTYHKTDVIEPLVAKELDVIPENFGFLFVGQWTSAHLFNDRKDIGNLIKTFLKTFRNWKGEMPTLILKTSGAAICNMDKYDMIDKLRTVRELVKQESAVGDVLPNVYLVYGDLTHSEMNSLYNHPKVKAHISFTHGEGFGHPLLLSTLSGKPIIAPNWSGHLDFLNPKLCKLLDGEVKQLPPESVNEWLVKESGWFNVNYSRAEDVMRNTVSHYKPYLEKAEELRIFNSQNFSEEAMDKKFHELLDKYVPTFAIEQPFVLPKLKTTSPKVV
jgi:hypothetical protein